MRFFLRMPIIHEYLMKYVGGWIVLMPLFSRTHSTPVTRKGEKQSSEAFLVGNELATYLTSIWVKQLYGLCYCPRLQYKSHMKKVSAPLANLRSTAKRREAGQGDVSASNS